MNYKYITVILLILSIMTSKLSAQEETQKTFDLNFRLGVNLGGTAPLPLPEEVRKIESYNPKFNPQIGFNLVYNLNERWGVGSGATFDWKGMRVRDEVKYMYTTVTEKEGGELTGYFVGKNMTNISMTHLTIPIYARYRFSDKWNVRLGIYASRVLSNKFDGNVTDGYMRVGTPTGQKQEIDEATFDFSDDARDYDFGLLGGGEFRLTNSLGIYADLSWGLVPYFYSKSNPIRFKMHNIYGTFGITYRLK